MTTDLGLRVPGQESGHSRLVSAPALSRLIDVDPATFTEQVWGRAAHLSPAAALGGGFTDLLDLDAVDELVSERGLRTPFLRVAKDGGTLPDAAFTAPGGVGAGIADQLSDDKLLALFADGATLVLQALHRTWPPLVRFGSELSAELGHPSQINAYVTPAQNQGFRDHYDTHDVFVLQCAGEKRWVIHEPVLHAPLRSQEWMGRRADVAAAAAREPLLDVVLRPGDCLYLPRGFVHAATALGGVSLHVTIGVHTWHRYTVAEQLSRLALAELADDADARTSLPMGTDLDEDATKEVDAVRRQLHAALDSLDSEAVLAALRSLRRESSRPALVRPLRQAEVAQSLSPDSLVTLRPYLDAELISRDSTTVLVSRAGRQDVAPGDLQALRTLLSGGVHSAADLGLELTRRLLRSGVVVLAG